MKFKFICVMILFLMFKVNINAQNNGVTNQLYIKFKEGFLSFNVDSDQLKIDNLLNKSFGKIGLDSAKCTFLFSKNVALRSTYRLWFENNDAAMFAHKTLRENEFIQYSEFVPELSKFLVPNDLGANSTNDGGQWYLHKINSQNAWDIQVGSNQVTVAIVDDAFQINHPDLNGVCFPGFDIVYEDFDVQPPNSSFDHGTHIAGLIGAKTNNNLGIASLAHGVNILPIKATLDNNPDIVAGGFEGIAWATENSVDVINCSWGASLFSQTGLEVVNNALSSNIVVVAAAGNFNNSVVQYPAGYNGVISVASTNISDSKSNTSSFGNWIDVSAPGNQIWSTIPFDSYSRKDGTSFSAPLVSALAALMKSKSSLLTPLEIETCIKDASDNINIFNPNHEGLLGSGRINAEQTLLCLSKDTLSYNLNLTSISNLASYSCNYNSTPRIKIKNDGLNEVSQFKVRSQLDLDIPFIYNFQGSLLPGDSVEIDMSEITISPGNHIYSAIVLENLNNSIVDQYFANNQLYKNFRVISGLGSQLPFFENFETESFIPNQWFLINESSQITWEINSSFTLAQGSKSARLNYYNDFIGNSRDYLFSKSLDFSAYSSVQLSFDHAYQQRFNALSDSLIISISDDCGETWSRLQAFYENGNFTFATVSPGWNEFLPLSDTSWCGQPDFVQCSEFDLTAYAGQANVILRFEGYSMNGNNIYIDNINVVGTPNNLPPVANFNASWDLPVCSTKQVSFSSISTGIPTFYTWTFEGGNPAVSNVQNPIISYSSAGFFDVQLIVQNGFGSDTLLWEDYVEVLESPTVTISTDADTICLGTSANLLASGASNYIWNAGQAMSSNDGPEVTVSPITSTNYIVNGITSAGCADTALQRIVVVTTPPQPSINVNGGTLVASGGVAWEWYFNGVLIENATGQFYTPTENGNYNVRVFIPGGCSSISGVFPVTFVGIEDLSDGDGILFFPNPATTFVKFYLPTTNLTWNVLDASGKLIQQGKALNSGWIELSTEAFGQGIYLMRFMDDQGQSTSTKFLVGH